MKTTEIAMIIKSYLHIFISSRWKIHRRHHKIVESSNNSLSDSQCLTFIVLSSGWQRTLAGWAKVFWVAAGINAGGAVIYTFLGSGKLQPWALTEEERAEAERKRNRSISH